MRYFVRLAYKGTSYMGWQKQPGQMTVQQTIEDHLSKILAQNIEVVGCGRTDSGVHALDYVLHFDLDGELPGNFIYRINRLLPDDIAFHHIQQVDRDAHARFDATSRSYVYRLGLSKDPFAAALRWEYPYEKATHWDLVQEAADLIAKYDSFYPFCKSNTDVKTMKCEIKHSSWTFNEKNKEWVYRIEANRFLRGMIRLIVGMCVNVGRNKLSLADVQKALENQTRLSMPLSAPAHGLFLNNIKYSYF